MTGTITFLDCDKDDPDRVAAIDRLPDGRWWIHNLNMPYMGTRSDVISQHQLESLQKFNRVKIEWNKQQ